MFKNINERSKKRNTGPYLSTLKLKISNYKILKRILIIKKESLLKNLGLFIPIQQKINKSKRQTDKEVKE